MFYKKIIFLLFLLAFLFSQGNDVFAMSSANYKIDADVIGVTGGPGSSDNYKLFDTAGEPVIGIGQSLNYKIKAGFAYMINYSLSLSIDSNTKNLGNVDPGSSVQGQSTLTVTTDSWGGYDILINENHSLLHTDTVTTIADYSCPIAAPCSWSGNGFGFTVNSGTGVEAKWGTDPNYNYAAIPLSGTIFHTKTGYTSGADNTVVGYNLAVSGAQRSGTYSNFVTYTAVAKL
jgi:hypothetical protein